VGANGARGTTVRPRAGCGCVRWPATTIPIAGEGVLRAGGDEIPLARGRFVLVTPDKTRQVVAGSEGLVYIVVGAVI
jgi:hypothetical protein